MIRRNHPDYEVSIFVMTGSLFLSFTRHRCFVLLTDKFAYGKEGSEQVRAIIGDS